MINTPYNRASLLRREISDFHLNDNWLKDRLATLLKAAEGNHEDQLITVFFEIKNRSNAILSEEIVGNYPLMLVGLVERIHGAIFPIPQGGVMSSTMRRPEGYELGN